MRVAADGIADRELQPRRIEMTGRPQRRADPFGQFDATSRPTDIVFIAASRHARCSRDRIAGGR